MTRYVVVDIGCLECGEESSLLEADTDRAGAERMGATFVDEQGFLGWDRLGMGQAVVVAFTIPEES